MNKQDFYEILESALLSFDGYSEQEINEKYMVNSNNIKIGIKLCLYLKSK